MSDSKIGAVPISNYADYPTAAESTDPAIQNTVVNPQTKDEYVVKRGDTLTKIAAKTERNLQELLTKNPQIKNPDRIYIGQKISLSAQKGTYIVKPGDTLAQIAADHKTTTGNILRANRGQIKNSNLIYPGQRLNIPVSAETKPAPSEKKTPEAPVVTKPAETVPVNKTEPAAKTVTSGNLEIKRIDLDDFLSPQKGSDAGYAILIGNAEGNRDSRGGKTPNYYGHRDPGDGKWNIGSFSYSNERSGAVQAKSPEDADRIQLTRLYRNKTEYVAAMNKAGLDANNSLLATVYLDMFNQSPTSAKNLLKPENLKYLKDNGITVETMKEWRFRGFVNAETGKRWVNPNGSVAGGNEKSGLAKIAHQNAQRQKGRPATEAEIQALIRRDQNRRVSEMIEPMKRVGLLTVKSDANITAPKETKPVETSSTGSTTASSTEFYRVRKDVILSANAKAKLTEIGIEYKKRTGSTFDITSGTRTPYRQARAMFTKIQLGDSFSDYKNRQALNEILETYRREKNNGKSGDQIIQAMASTIQSQVDRQVYISRHLRGGAADVSMRGLNQKAFREAVKAATGQEPHYEGKPPHFHLQF